MFIRMKRSRRKNSSSILKVLYASSKGLLLSSFLLRLFANICPSTMNSSISTQVRSLQHSLEWTNSSLLRLRIWMELSQSDPNKSLRLNNNKKFKYIILIFRSPGVLGFLGCQRMCFCCYNKLGKPKKANKCEHVDSPLYCQGLC